MERQSRVHLDHPTVRGRMRSPRVRRAHVSNGLDQDIRPIRPTTSQTESTQQLPLSPLTSTPTSQRPTSAAAQVQSNQIADKQTAPPLRSASATNQAKAQPAVLKIRTTPLQRSTTGGSAHLPRQTRSGVLRRQVVKASAKKYRPKKHHSFKPYLAAGLAAFLLVLASTTGFVVYKKINGSSGPTQVLAKQTSKGSGSTSDGTSGSDLPSEDNPPLDIKGYTVAANMPRYLKIDRIGVNARVRRVGPDSNGSVKGPTNIYDVGWYENSSLPGENGTILLDGHVAGQSNRGVFYGLGTLKKSDKVTIERGDGKLLTYTVVSAEQADFDNLDMRKVLNSAVSGKQGLNLMTASGRFNVRTNQYEKRVIVYTVQD